MRLVSNSFMSFDAISLGFLLSFVVWFVARASRKRVLVTLCSHRQRFYPCSIPALLSFFLLITYDPTREVRLLQVRLFLVLVQTLPFYFRMLSSVVADHNTHQ
jgi:hypothetical protein